MKITILYDDNKLDNNLEKDHGFSAFIEFKDHKILFDTGTKEKILIDNAKKLGINLEKVEHVILSHGHYDHTGGANYFIDRAKIYAHPKIFEDKYRDSEGKQYIGIPLQFKDKLKEKVIFNKEKKEILPNTFLSGQVNVKKKSGLYHKTRQGYTNDWMDDEQFLTIETQKGLIIITGCSHKGLNNIINHILANFQKPIYTIIGGLHLKDASTSEIAKNAKYLTNFTKEVYYCHCTGEKASKIIEKAINGQKVYAGSIINL